MREVMVQLNVRVKVVINDEDVVRRPVENVDGWRDDLYNLYTEEMVFEHLAYNAVMNSRVNAKSMDGFADLAEEAVIMNVIDAEFDSMEPVNA